MAWIARSFLRRFTEYMDPKPQSFVERLSDSVYETSNHVLKFLDNNVVSIYDKPSFASKAMSWAWWGPSRILYPIYDYLVEIIEPKQTTYLVHRVTGYMHLTVILLLLSLAILLATRKVYGAVTKQFIPWLDTKRRDVLSRVIQYGKIAPVVNVDLVKAAFRECIVPPIRNNNPTHSHPLSASWRTSTTDLVLMLSAKVGLAPYMYQASKSDLRKGLRGSRCFFWDKDTEVDYAPNHPGRDDLVVLVDVDYYVDMPHFLLTTPGPVLLYTFQPKAAARSEGEFSYMFDKNNTVEYVVSGGAVYRHKIWNYGKDIIAVSSPLRTRTFLVERRAANEDHEFVLLLPTGDWRFPYNCAVNTLSLGRLERLAVNAGEYNVLQIQTIEGAFTSVCRPGEANAATIDNKTLSALFSVVRTATLKVGLATVQTYVKDKLTACTLTDYLRTYLQATAPDRVFTPATGLHKYQMMRVLEDYDRDDKCPMVPFMTPIVPWAFVPAIGKNNEDAGVTGRILLPMADSAKLVAAASPARDLAKHMREFCEQLIPTCDAHKALRVDVAEVYRRQARPSQRALLEQAEVTVYEREVKSFIKVEAGTDISDPRLISTFNAADKREYSRVVYPFSDYIATKPWYAFSKPPISVAAAIGEMCTKAKDIVCVDASRMDGHINDIARDFERMILVRFFDRAEHAEIADAHQAHYAAQAGRTRHGIRYEFQDVRGSGEVGTAVFNTLTSKFMDYRARRLNKATPDEAYSALGMFGGDDVIATGMGSDNQLFVTAGSDLGQRLEVAIFERGSYGVNFLARIYEPAVWEGSVKSNCDLARILSKLHVTGNMDKVTPLEKLQQKLSGLVRTDRHTPLIAELLFAAERLGMSLAATPETTLAGWWSQYAEDVNWPCAEPDAEHFMQLALPGADASAYLAHLTKAGSLEDLLNCPSVIEYRQRKAPKCVVVVDDDTVLLPSPVVPVTPALCWAYVRGECKGDCGKPHKQVCRAYAENNCVRKNCKFLHVKQ